jgi:hypothetical protein
MDYIALAQQYGWIGALGAGVLYVAVLLIRRGVRIRIDAEIPPREARARSPRDG